MHFLFKNCLRSKWRERTKRPEQPSRNHRKDVMAERSEWSLSPLTTGNEFATSVTEILLIFFVVRKLPFEARGLAVMAWNKMCQVPVPRIAYCHRPRIFVCFDVMTPSAWWLRRQHDRYRFGVDGAYPSLHDSGEWRASPVWNFRTIYGG